MQRSTYQQGKNFMAQQRQDGLPEKIGMVTGILVVIFVLSVLGFAFWNGAT